MNYKYIFFSLFLLISPFVQGQILEADSNLLSGRLDNGLQYYIYPHGYPEDLVTLRLYIQAGSILEKENQLGLAHFVEHMAFNGTKNFEKNELITYLESKGVTFGSDLNAHTSFDETVYKLQIPAYDSTAIDTAMMILADWAHNITFDSLEIEKERGVVIEEWRSGQGPGSRMRQAYLPRMLNYSRYAERLPIGDTAIIKNFVKRDLVSFYEDWYQPQLMAVAVTGDISANYTMKKIKENFGDLKNKKDLPRLYYPIPPSVEDDLIIVTDAEAVNVDFSLYNITNTSNVIRTENDYLQFLTAQVYNRLNQNRFNDVEDTTTLFRSADLGFKGLFEHSSGLMGGVSLYGDKIEEGIRGYLTEVERIHRYGFTTSEIDIIRKNLLLQFKSSFENQSKSSSATYLNDIKSLYFKGYQMVSKKEEYRLAKKYLPLIDSTRLMDYLRQLPLNRYNTYMITGPDSLRADMPTKNEVLEWVSAIQSSDLHPPLNKTMESDRLLNSEIMAGQITREVIDTTIDIEILTLDNGARVILKPTELDNNQVLLSGFRNGGLMALDSTKYLTSLFVKSIVAASGYGDFSRDGLSQYLAGSSASAIFVMAKNRNGIAGNAKSEELEQMLELMYLKWHYPRLDTSLIENILNKTIESVENSKKSPSYPFSIALNQRIAGHNYTTEPLSEQRIVDEFKAEDVTSLYHQSFGTADGFTFILVGNFDAKEVKPLIETYIGGIKGEKWEDPGLSVVIPAIEKTDSLIMYAGEADKSRVNIFFQNSEFDYSSEWSLKLEMLEEVLKVKLRENLREDNGGVYGVGVSASSAVSPSPLYRIRIAFGCSPENTPLLVDQVWKEIDAISNDADYFAVEVENIKTQMMERHRKRIEKNSYWTSVIRDHYYQKLDNWDLITQYSNLLDSITASDIRIMCQQLLVNQPYFKAVLYPETFVNQ